MVKKSVITEFIPKWIAWEATGRCNLSCIHCRSSSTLGSSEGDFTTEEAFKLIDDITSFSKPAFVLSGGEPLLRKDIFDIAEYGTKKGLRVCMATNGTLVNDDVSKNIKASGIKIVSLSLDGSTSEIHDNFRNQKGAFEGTLRGIEYLKKHNIDFLINSSFTKRNRSEIPKVYQLAKDLGATAWYMFLIVPTGRGQEIIDELIPADEYEEILTWHFYKELEEKEMLMRPTCAPHYYRICMQRAKEDGIKYERRNLKFSTGGAKGCLAAQLICLIDSFGNVQPCSYFPEVAGNVKETPFREIWENSPLFKSLRDFDAYRGKCGSCEYLSVCGGCRARAEVIYGHYLDEEPFCNYIPYRTRKKQKVKEAG